MAAILAATGLVAAPLLPARTAYADVGDQDDRTGIQTVDFVGGSVLSMLMCRSQPSVDRLTVPAESRVMFVNRLGQAAVLRVNGKVMAQVGPDQAVPVVFYHGPVSVSMTFPCGTGVAEQFATTAVSVAAAAAPQVPRLAAPVPPPAVSPTTQPTYSPSPTARTRAVAPTSPPGAGSLATVAAASPVASRSPEPVAPSTAAPVDAALAAADTSSDVGRGGGVVAVEPLVRAADTTRDGSSGVLALLAAACAVCVTIAVMRAIISKPNKPSAIRVR